MKLLGPLLVLAALGIAIYLGLDAMQQAPATDTPGGPAAYQQALAEAKENRKPIMLMFTASWCGPCRQMKNNVFPSSIVQAERPKWNWVLLDVDDPANADLSRQFGVRGIPAFFLLSPDGKKLHSFSGARPADQFAATLRKYAAN